MALAIFPQSALREAIFRVAAVSDSDGFARLQQLSLVKLSGVKFSLVKLSAVKPKQERYDMLPLTREYALAELADFPEFEREAICSTVRENSASEPKSSSKRGTSTPKP